MKKYTCKRCGWSWVGRTAKPIACPECKSRQWREPKQEKKDKDDGRSKD